MTLPRAFQSLARTLTRSSLGVPCTITMDGVAIATSYLPVERQIETDVDNQVYIVGDPRFSFRIADLPRLPAADDVIVTMDETYRIFGPGTVTGAGTVECPIRKA